MASYAAASDVYRSPYEQRTNNRVANTPLFSLMFPRAATRVAECIEDEAPRAGAVSGNKANPDLKEAMEDLLRENPVPPEQMILQWASQSPVQAADIVAAAPAAEAIAAAAVSPVQSPVVMRRVWSPPHQASEMTYHPQQQSTSSKTEDCDTYDDLLEEIAKPPEVPFYLRLQETEKRFKEQLAVHRGIDQAMNELDTLGKEIRVHRAEQRTSFLVSELQSRSDDVMSRVFPAGWPPAANAATTGQQFAGAPPPFPVAAARTAADSTKPGGAAGSDRTGATSPSPVNSALKDILASFSQPRRAGAASSSVGGSTKQEAIPVVKKLDALPCGVIRPEEPPKPYRRIHWVRRPPQVAATSPPTDAGEDKYTDDFVPDEDGVASMGDSIGTEVISDASTSNGSVETAAIESEYENNSSASIADDASYSSVDDSGDNFIESVSHGDNDSDMFSDDVEDAVDDDVSTPSRRRSNRKRAAKGAEVDNATLSRVLGEFYDACRRANGLASLLSDGKLSKDAAAYRSSQPRYRRRSSDGTLSTKDTTIVQNDEDGGSGDWQDALRKDFTDVRRLRRFNKHLVDHLKALDIQRRVVREKQKLLQTAQKLAKTRKRLRANKKSALKDVVEDEVVEDLLFPENAKKKRRGRGGDSDSSMADEIPYDIEDDLLSVAAGSDDIEDEIDDEFDMMYGSGDDDDDIVDDLMDEGDWGEGTPNSNGSIVDDFMMDAVASGSSAHSISDAGVMGAMDDEDLVLDDIEDDFADRIADLSDVADIVDDIEQLPYTSADGEDDIADEVSDVVTDNAVESMAASSVRSVPESKPDSSRKTADDISLDASVWDSSSAHEGDVSSVVPNSSTTSDGVWSDDDDEDADYEHLLLEANLADTKHRRQAAIRSAVKVPTFSRLYDPNESTPSLSAAEDNDEALMTRLNALQSASTKYTEAGRGGMLVPDQYGLLSHQFGVTAEQQDRASSPLLPVLRAYEESAPSPAAAVASADASLPAASRMNEDEAAAYDRHAPPASYVSEDLVALQSWKDRQIAMFREILPSPSENRPLGSAERLDDYKPPQVGSFAHHWGVLEALLETRFASQQQQDLPDYDDERLNDAADMEPRASSIPYTSTHDELREITSS